MQVYYSIKKTTIEINFISRDTQTDTSKNWIEMLIQTERFSAVKFFHSMSQFLDLDL